MAPLHAALVVAVLCSTVFADGEGPSELQAVPEPLDDGFVKVTLTWKNGSCANEDTEFTVTVNGTQTSLKTKALSLSIANLEYWTNYTFLLAASEPCPKEAVSTTAHTGSGSPHKVEQLNATAVEKDLQILVREAFMPRAVDYYVISLSKSSSPDDVLAMNLARNSSNVNGEMWNTSLRGVLDPEINYSVRVEPVIKEGEKLWTGAGSTVDFRSPRTDFPTPSNLKVSVDGKNAKPGEKVHADVDWEYEGSDYAFFRVSWGLIGRYPEVVLTAIKHLRIDNLKFNESYTIQVDTYFRIDGKDVPKTNVNTSFEAIGVLLPPHDVEIAHLNYSRALLGWKVDSPPDSDIKTSDLKFTVEYQAKGQPSKSIVVSTATAELKDLERSTEYTAKITTTYDNWRSASLQSYNFKTRDEDWPAAEMKTPTVTSKGTEDKAMYDFSWKIQKVDVEHAFQVVICAPSCVTIDKTLQDKDLKYPLDYYQDYNVTVKTIYGLPLAQTVTRVSNVVKGKSTVGVPGAVGAKNIEQRLNKLVLTWEAPKETRGPVSSYEVNVWDSVNEKLKSTQRFDDTKGTIDLPRLTKSTYKLSVTPIAIDGTTEYRGPIGEVETRDLLLLAPPQDVKTVGKTEDSIQLEVTPSSTLEGIIYKAEWHGGSDSTNFMTNKGELQNLKPYEAIEFNVSSCFMDGAKELRCGTPFSGQSRSNVGSPLEVGNFNYTIQDDVTVALTWEKPEVANGPIHGYKIEIFEPSTPDATRRTFIEAFNNLAFNVTGNAQDTLYNVTIAAYNDDSITSEHKFGEVTSIQAYTRGTTGRAGWVLPVVVLVVLVLGGLAAVGFYTYRKRMQAPGSAGIGFAFFNNRGNDQV